MKIFKQTSLILLFVLITIRFFAVEKLNMYISTHRFMDKSGDTILNIDYQIPYRNLVFLSQKGAFFAELETVVTVARGDSVVYSRPIQDVVGISNKYDITSSGKSYLNRISLLLGKGEHQIRFETKDINAMRSFVWDFVVSPYQPKTLISDIELNSSVKADSSQYLDKFKRGATLYKSEPSMLFHKDTSDEMYLYYEIYPPQQLSGKKMSLMLILEQNDEIILDQLFEISPLHEVEGRTIKLPLSQLGPGLHYGTMSAYCDTLVDTRYFEFVVTEKSEQLYFAFADPDEEYNLMKYFVSSKLPSNWKSMDKEAKRYYISQFWQVLAAANGVSPEVMLSTTDARIKHSNKFYTHFAPGWTTDMGRIFIKNGAPDDIEKEQTSDDTKFVRKDYQIWRYSLKKNAVYVFIDIQMNGNYKLIHVLNDDTEFSNPDWQNYLGSEFDSSKLRN